MATLADTHNNVANVTTLPAAINSTTVVFLEINQVSLNIMLILKCAQRTAAAGSD